MTDDPKPEEPSRPEKELDVDDIQSPLAESDFDFEAYRKKVLADPKAREAIEFFLKHRHREWEESLASCAPPSGKRK